MKYRTLSNPMLIRKSIKIICFLITSLFFFKADTAFANAAPPIAKAGPDQTIYLTQTSSVTLNGSSSSGDTFLWTDISTDYKSGAIISKLKSATTTVNGLIQGTFYYQLAVTSGGVTARDTVVIRVDYDVPPANSNLIKTLPLKEMASFINNRSDTVTCWNPINDPNEFHTTYFINATENIWLERARSNGLMIDSSRGKIYSTIEDGYKWGTGSYGDYNRSELSYESTFRIDSNKTYIFEWKGYFPQSFDYLNSNAGIASALAIFQLHPGDEKKTLFQFSIQNDGYLAINENVYNEKGTQFFFIAKNIARISELYNKTHTLRISLREGKGYPGQKGFIKVEWDGVQKYLRDTGKIGSTKFQSDYIKFASMYDYGRMFVNPDSLSRGRKASLVTEEFRVYQLKKNIQPLAYAGSNITITLPVSNATLIGTGTDADEKIINYSWNRISGPDSYNVVDNASAVTDVTGLVQGTYWFELKVTDIDGAVGRDTVQVTVYPAPFTLPLSWLDVQAQRIGGNKIKVSWQVADQQNVKDYTVQYSSDGNNFINAHSVVSSAITSYNCIVSAYKNTNNYYRVMQTDMDGKTTYSKIVLLPPSAKSALSVYPNPAQDKLYIQGIDNFSGATISDTGGKVINHYSFGANAQYIDISKLAKGIYFINLASVNDAQTIKFIKE